MQDVRIDPWQIERVSPVDDFSETIFFVGNGNLGVRGFGACSAGEYGMETVSALLNLVFRITGKPPAALTFFCQVPIIYGCWKYSSVPAVRRRYGVREGNRQRR